MNLAQEISRIINPDGSEPVSLTAENQAFIRDYQPGLAALSEEEASTLAFMNVIIKEGRCGFASGGSYDYLLNTDTTRRYRVTVRTYWRQGINQGEYYARQVVGESLI